jgi:GNAT superfamily N-acetyltransferase
MLDIRAATADDAVQIFEVARDFATSFQLEQGAFAQSLEHLLAKEGVELLVAADAGLLLGYLLGFIHDTFYANGPVAWVEEITVRESSRSGGIGRQLMAAFEAAAAGQDAKLVALATRRAAGFYSALGYEDSAVYFRKLL